MTENELCNILSQLSEISTEFQATEDNEKRVGNIIVPTNERMSILEDYISRWAWLIVQKGSERESAPEDMPQIAEEDSKLNFREAVLELVLYGMAYLSMK